MRGEIQYGHERIVQCLHLHRAVRDAHPFGGEARGESERDADAAEGRCAISVSKRFSKTEYENFIEWANKAFGLAWCMTNLWDWDEVKAWRGCIVAVADYKAVDAVPEDDLYGRQCRIWDEGYPNWWLLSNVKRLQRLIPCRGNVGMWQPDAEIVRELNDWGQIP